MTTLLFPGRHLLTTRFQEDYLRHLLSAPLISIKEILPGKLVPVEPIGRIVFAITSSNQEHSRFNPVAFYLRSIGVDRLGHSIAKGNAVQRQIFGIPHYGHTTNFAEFTLKEVHEQSERAISLSPENTIVLCSTPEVVRLYQALGFSIAPAELGMEPRPVLPIDLIRRLGESGERWSESPEITANLSQAATTWLRDFPEIAVRVARIYRDPLTNQEGSLTDTRDYNTYARGMAGTVRFKYLDIAEAIRPGRIVDEGCADGALLVEIAKSFPDSDLYGVDLSAEFAHRFNERQRAGEFRGTYTHFLLRNLMDPLFEDDSIDTTICNSTLHELWSYAEQEKTVRRYLELKVAQLRPGGRLVVRDVVGPEQGGIAVFLVCSEADGGKLPASLPAGREAEWLNSLSTAARFRLFSHDFLREIRASGRRHDPLPAELYQPVEREGHQGYLTTLRHAAEFLSKKDYTDNWCSEMNEEFCFWSHTRWRQFLTEGGLRVIDERESKGGSRVYTNPWVVEHRYQGRVSLWSPDGGEPLAFPPTNHVLVAEKPRD